MSPILPSSPVRGSICSHPEIPIGRCTLDPILEAQNLPIRQTFGESTLLALSGLADESDPSAFWEGLNAVAQELERDARLEGAACLYSLLSEQTTDPALQERARSRLRIIQGQGSGWGHVEFLSHRLIEETFSPRTLFPFLIAEATMGVYSSVLFGRFARLGNGLRPSPLQFAQSHLFGFVAGISVYAFTERLIGNMFAPESAQDWSSRRLGDEMWRAVLTLGALHLFRFFGEAAFRRFALSPALRARSRVDVALFREACTYSGVVVGHMLENANGFRESRSWEITLTDALATYLQYRVLYGSYNLATRGLIQRRIDLMRHGAFPQIFPPPV